MEQSRLGLSNEILTALLSAKVGESQDKLKAGASDFVAENYGVDLSTYDLSVVENTEAEVHLSLPYYTGLEEAKAKAIADSDVADVAGGDIMALIVSLIVVAAAGGAVAAGIGGGLAAGSRK